MPFVDEPRNKPSESAGSTLIGVIARFIGSALFGLLLSFAFFALAVEFSAGARRGADASSLADILMFCAYIAPLVTGILGIFWFEQILDIVSKFFSLAMLASGRRRRRW